MQTGLLVLFCALAGFVSGFPCSDLVKFEKNVRKQKAVFIILKDIPGVSALDVNLTISDASTKEIETIKHAAEIKSRLIRDLIEYSVEYPDTASRIEVTAVVFNGKLICQTDLNTASITFGLHHTAGMENILQPRKKRDVSFHTNGGRRSFGGSGFRNKETNGFIQTSSSDGFRQSSPIASKGFRQTSPGNFRDPSNGFRQTSADNLRDPSNGFRQTSTDNLRDPSNGFRQTSTDNFRDPSNGFRQSAPSNGFRQSAPNPNNNGFRNSGFRNPPEPNQGVGEGETPTAPGGGEDSEEDDDPNCGFTENNHLNLINGGQLAVKGDFPWTVAIFLKTINESNSIYICAGNQISEKHVMTASHCTNIQKNRLFVVPGLIHLDDANTDTRYEIRAIHKHPKYESRLPHHDVAIMTVTRRMPGMPVCLWPKNAKTDRFVGSKGVVLGWGRYNKDIPEASEWLKMIEMPIVSQETCIFSDVRFRHLVTQDTFCGGDRDLTGPCAGDSGGGFNLKINGKYYLRGIVSTAISNDKKCDLSNYIIFTDIAKHINWVYRIINS